ncbi:MAG: hypothetical protein P8184_04275 [Calditrichia bacterium]
MSRRQVKDYFKALWSNDDESKYRLSRKVLDNQFLWLEEGGVGIGVEDLLERKPIKQVHHNGKVIEAVEML